MTKQIFDTTHRTFEEHVLRPSYKQLVFVNFEMSWSKPSRYVGKQLEEIQEKSAEDFILAKVNLGNAPKLAHICQVTKLPTIVVFDRGQIIERLVGQEHPYMLHQFARKAMLSSGHRAPFHTGQLPEEPRSFTKWLNHLFSPSS